MTSGRIEAIKRANVWLVFKEAVERYDNNRRPAGRPSLTKYDEGDIIEIGDAFDESELDSYSLEGYYWFFVQRNWDYETVFEAQELGHGNYTIDEETAAAIIEDGTDTLVFGQFIDEHHFKCIHDMTAMAKKLEDGSAAVIGVSVNDD